MLRLIRLPFLSFVHNGRFNSSFTASCLKYEQYGEPAEVLKIVEEKIESPTGSEVIVKILAAPVNPADINTVQGKYPVKVTFPATGGNEFVGEVICVGPDVKSYCEGDHVIPNKNGLGSWRTIGKFCENDLQKISNKIGIAEAATITVNPCTAYRMLKDFVKLKCDDTVILNGANSAVGQFTHQFCKAWGINSVGIIRNSPNVCPTIKYLKSLGASEILTEEQVRKTEIFKGKTPKFKKPVLALNCIGGKSSAELARHLNHNGVMVTYGGMSMQPVMIPTANLIFKDMCYRGFWMTRWQSENSKSPEREKMFNEICELMENGEVKAAEFELIPLNNYKESMTLRSKKKKAILNMQEQC